MAAAESKVKHKNVGQDKAVKMVSGEVKQKTLAVDHALNGIMMSPYKNGLNPAASAGIEIARNILEKNQKSEVAATIALPKVNSFASLKMPKGLTESGFLDEDED